MNTTFKAHLSLSFFLCLSATAAVAADDAALPKAGIDGNGPGWRSLGEADFVNVNCADDTWTFKNGEIQCTGQPVGVMRMKEPIKNFELVVQWKHLKSAGNSGVFLWASEKSIEACKEGAARKDQGKKDERVKRLPDGIEVQILDHGYLEQHLKNNKGKDQKSVFFTTNGDVFPTGEARLKPFEPTSPNGSRSFPRKELTKGFGEWNHYYIRAINGEVRLWVNGEEVSGGTRATPADGYLCLESEGSPIEFKNLRLRELP